MLFGSKLFRRDFIKNATVVLSGLFLSPLLQPTARLFGQKAAGKAGDGSKIVVVKGKDLSKDSIRKMVAEGFLAMGGIGRFIKKGTKVAIKPNIGWNSPPERAHNTNPDLIEAVAKICLQAGANVKIFDRSVNPEKLSYRSSGIAAAAENAGAEIALMDPRRYREVPVPNGLNQKTLMVYEDILDADVVINMPIAKHHSLSTLTMAMKNWMGVLGGNRGRFHWSIDKNIVDFTKAVRADLVILDATRILTAHGPNAGSPSDVRVLHTIVMGTNPVTVDAYATTLFGMKPRDLDYLILAAKEGMGEISLGRMNIVKKTV